MKKILTNNIGLKIASLLVSVLLWIIVVNVDDPVITRVYSGVTVDIVNASSVAADGKTYEIEGGNEPISVAVTANRSVIEKLTKNDIKATADLKNLIFSDTIPIELKTTIYSDKVTSLSSRTAYRTVTIEDKVEKQVKLSIKTTGEVSSGHYAGEITPEFSVVTVKGPKSKVELVKSAEISVDYSGMNETEWISSQVVLYDEDGKEISDPTFELSKTEIRVTVEVLATKEVSLVAGGYVGTPAAGFGATGEIVFDPSSIIIAGKASNLDKISKVVIPAEKISVEGASGRTTIEMNVKDYLPEGTVYVDERNDDGIVNVTAVVEPHESLTVDILKDNISVINLPEGYSFNIVYGEDTMKFDISGLPEDLSKINPAEIKGQIDASELIPQQNEEQENGEDEEPHVHEGVNRGNIILVLPQGIVQNGTTSVEVVINHLLENEGTEGQ